MLALTKLIGIHAEAHEQPAERHWKHIDKLLGETLCFGLSLHQARTGYRKASETLAATLPPRICAAAARRSSIRALVHDPIKMRLTAISGFLTRLKIHVR